MLLKMLNFNIFFCQIKERVISAPTYLHIKVIKRDDDPITYNLIRLKFACVIVYKNILLIMLNSYIYRAWNTTTFSTVATNASSVFKLIRLSREVFRFVWRVSRAFFIKILYTSIVIIINWHFYCYYKLLYNLLLLLLMMFPVFTETKIFLRRATRRNCKSHCLLKLLLLLLFLLFSIYCCVIYIYVCMVFLCISL